MTTDPILQEVMQIKDALAVEAENDLHRMCEIVRQWRREHPTSGPIVQNAEDLHRYYEAHGTSELLLREESTDYNAKA